MGELAVQDAAVESAPARSTLYRFLSLGWWPPEDGLEALAAEEALAEVHRAAARLGHADLADHAAAVGARLRQTGAADLREEYRRLFGHQIARDCPLHETQYGGSHIFQQTQQLADIAGFYLAFGLDLADGIGERADHLSLELEFMHALAFRQAYAAVHHGAEEVALLHEAQRAFLRDHLGRWVPTFARLVARRGAGFYSDLAGLLAAFVLSEAAAFGLPADDEAELAPPASLDPEDSGGACGPDRCPLDSTAEPQP